VKLGERTAGWPEHETEAINAARLTGKTPDEIRALVKGLEARRATGFDAEATSAGKP
jgi:prophage regulatory protein